MKIAAALIVKNEAQTLGRCIRSLERVVDEIVVLDTGSTDGTQPVAINHPMCRLIKSKLFDENTRFTDFHFADARNELLEHVDADWVISIDADEVLEADAGGLRDVLMRCDQQAWMTLVRCEQRDQHWFAGRLFRNVSTIRWTRRVHEMLTHRFALDQSDWLDANVLKIVHKPAKGVRDSASNYVTLLERQAKDEGRIGQTWVELAQAWRDLEDEDRALGCAETFLATGSNGVVQECEAMHLCAGIYIKRGAMSRAIQYGERIVSLCPGNRKGYLTLVAAYVRAQMYEQALYYLRAAMRQSAEDTFLPSRIRDVGDEQLRAMESRIHELMQARAPEMQEA